jgi:hypothetical protein
MIGADHRLIAENGNEVQIPEKLQGLSLKPHDPDFIASRDKALVEEDEDAEARTIHEIDLRQVEDQVIGSRRKLLELTPFFADVSRIEIICNFVFHRHESPESFVVPPLLILLQSGYYNLKEN